MIQGRGKVEAQNEREAIAIASKLSALGKKRTLVSAKKGLLFTWAEPQYTQTDRRDWWAEEHNPFHTLSDFGLLPGGNPMLTMEEIERGGKYVVREDLEAGKMYGGCSWWKRSDHLRGKPVTVKDTTLANPIYENANVDLVIVAECGEYLTPAMLSHRVEEEGLTQEQDDVYSFYQSYFGISDPKPCFEFGDKVRVDSETDPFAYVTKTGNDRIVVVAWSESDRLNKSDIVSVHSVAAYRVAAWPETERVSLNCEAVANLSHEGMVIDGQNVFETVSPEAMDDLCDRWLKIRKP